MVSIVFLKFIVFCLWAHPSTDSRREALNAISLLSVSSLAVFILICCTEWICYGCWLVFCSINHTVGTFGDVVLDVHVLSGSGLHAFSNTQEYCKKLVGEWDNTSLACPMLCIQFPALNQNNTTRLLCIVYISCFVINEHFNRYNFRFIINTNLLKTPF